MLLSGTCSPCRRPSTLQNAIPLANISNRLSTSHESAIAIYATICRISCCVCLRRVCHCHRPRNFASCCICSIQCLCYSRRTCCYCYMLYQLLPMHPPGMPLPSPSPNLPYAVSGVFTVFPIVARHAATATCCISCCLCLRQVCHLRRTHLILLHAIIACTCCICRESYLCCMPCQLYSTSPVEPDSPDFAVYAISPVDGTCALPAQYCLVDFIWSNAASAKSSSHGHCEWKRERWRGGGLPSRAVGNAATLRHMELSDDWGYRGIWNEESSIMGLEAVCANFSDLLQKEDTMFSH